MGQHESHTLKNSSATQNQDQWAPVGRQRQERQVSTWCFPLAIRKHTPHPARWPWNPCSLSYLCRGAAVEIRIKAIFLLICPQNHETACGHCYLCWGAAVQRMQGSQKSAHPAVHSPHTHCFWPRLLHAYCKEWTYEHLQAH